MVEFSQEFEDMMQKRSTEDLQFVLGSCYSLPRSDLDIGREISEIQILNSVIIENDYFPDTH